VWGEGWIFRAGFQAGRYDAGSTIGGTGDVDTNGAEIQIGYRKRIGVAWFGIYVGPSYETHRNDDPAAAIRGTEFGGKVTGDFYMPLTTVTNISAQAFYATPFHTYYVTGRLGLTAVVPGWTIGPEVATFGNEAYRDFRAGAFVNVPTWFGHLIVSGGSLTALSDAKSGYYVNTHLGFNLNR
jgi:hypothetical protein